MELYLAYYAVAECLSYRLQIRIQVFLPFPSLSTWELTSPSLDWTFPPPTLPSVPPSSTPSLLSHASSVSPLHMITPHPYLNRARTNQLLSDVKQLDYWAQYDRRPPDCRSKENGDTVKTKHVHTKIIINLQVSVGANYNHYSTFLLA